MSHEKDETSDLNITNYKEVITSLKWRASSLGYTIRFLNSLTSSFNTI